MDETYTSQSLSGHLVSVPTGSRGYGRIERITPHTAPPELHMAGRFNLTFRQYDI